MDMIVFLGRRKNLLARNRSSAGDGLGGQLQDQGETHEARGVE
jgi:hypothetical protein